MLDQIEQYQRLGFSLHWLKPRSKSPIEMGWTKKPRKTLEDLRKSYKDGCNLGVRLGSTSKISGGYLAVIDCDVKSTDRKHCAEMLKRLREIFPEITKAPLAWSGRGNGSSHSYVITKTPVQPTRLSQSNDLVEVLMPSVKPSKRDREHLNDARLEKGYRMRPAWEISLMGEGQQVVLPPSIHPDTGHKYRWESSSFEDLNKLPLFQPPAQAVKTRETSDVSPQAFKPVLVDLISSRLSDAVIGQITDGEDVSDRSAALLSVTNSMVRAGFTDDEILTVLTDKDNFLGEAAFDHAQTSNRAKAAEWIRKYTLIKAKRDHSAEEIFKAEVVVGNVLDEAQSEAQLAATAPPSEDWRERLERARDGSKPLNTFKNVFLILTEEGGKTIFKRDDFANAELYGRDAPWGVRAGTEVSDIDVIRIKSWLAEKFRFEPSNDRINEAVSKIADLNRYHPVRDYLDRLEWDGVARIDAWLKVYLGAVAREPYLSAVSRKVLCALVARIYRPGVKFDQILILQGSQGVGKSTALRKLVGDEWFSDAHIDTSDKDSVVLMRSRWLMEMGELSSIRKSELDQLKSFTSRTTDRIRLPYGKRAENFPRQCVFVGTTNEDEYLKDPSGERRFWPVKVGDCRFDLVERDRDQLFAEAVWVWKNLEEPLYLEDKETQAAARLEQGERKITDPFEDLFLEWESEQKSKGVTTWIDRTQFTMQELFGDYGPFKKNRGDRSEHMRVGNILKKLGFEKRQKRVNNRNSKVWTKELHQGGET